MPEGDTIFRAARTLDRALAGRVVTAFETVLPRLMRVDADQPLRGRRVERVEARGKHLVIHFSGGLLLRTHMRMHGSWHIYRPGERWQRPHRDMRIVIRTDAFEAVAFNVPIAAFVSEDEVARDPALQELGPDPLAADFDPAEAARRIAARGDLTIADALLDQRAIAGVGNVFKSEVLFACRVHPFSAAGSLPAETIEALVRTSTKLLRANVAESEAGNILTGGGSRNTTGRADPRAKFWVYGRGGEPCRRCGTPIQRMRHGVHARSTYWCPRCQAG